MGIFLFLMLFARPVLQEAGMSIHDTYIDHGEKHDKKKE